MLISVVVPLYNESKGLKRFNVSLVNVLNELINDEFELIYCDDGSMDNTLEVLNEIQRSNRNIKIVKLTRNFGKENALTAGIAQAKGSAILTIDGDGQHPVELIPEFINHWQQGAKLIIGVRKENKHEKMLKKAGSLLFYKLLRLFIDKSISQTSDFRLMDSSVQKTFLQLKESSRLTRGLIDWLGYKPAFIEFNSKARIAGKANYSTRKLMELAINSYIGLSPKPLYIFGYLGIIITFFAFILGLSVVIEQIVLSDPLQWKFTGTAMLGILILFLVGMLLMSQGILSLYISRIHDQSKGRPLYVIDEVICASSNLNDKS